MDPPPRPVMITSPIFHLSAYRMAPTISGGASGPWTRTGSRITLAMGYRRRRMRIMSWTAAPAPEVTTAIRSG